MRVAALILLLACHTQAAPKAAELPMGAVRFETTRGPWVVRVEIANTEETRQRGLMYRRDLPPDRGMIFLFDKTAEHGFWMRNTLLSLDMIFLGEDRTVVGVVARAEPKSDVIRTVKKPSRYVVEVSAGEAAAHAVGPGMRAVFIDIPE
jgi:uncharacterized membrane protein (UPF0127 family)